MIRSIFALLVGLLCATTHGAESKPNVIIFYLDDMGWAQPGCYGGKLVPTPNIDALAQGGVRFTNGYVSACVCAPSRVGLMTGRYQARSGHDANTTERAGSELVLTETTMAQRMKELGYATAITGKWHLGSGADFLPAARGFDVSVGTVGNLGEGKGASFYRGKELLAELPGAPVTSPVFAREAVSFIDAHKAAPFFLYLPFNAVHTPHVASDAWLAKVAHIEDRRDREYAALAGEADEAIGTVMAKLRELSLEENTLIFCISDNGGAAPQAEMGGLRGRKWLVWEGGIRVSWIAQWKGRIPAGRVLNEPVIQLDVLPTALAAGGGSPTGPNQLDGANLMPLLEGKVEKLDPRPLFWRFGVQYAVRSGDWKLVKASQDMQPMLVNLGTDPGEQKDLSNEHPEKKAELQKLFDTWNAGMQQPRWEDRRWNGEEARKAQKKGKPGKKKKKGRENA
jgi:arylsulfatase A-like enzyme